MEKRKRERRKITKEEAIALRETKAMFICYCALRRLDTWERGRVIRWLKSKQGFYGDLS